ncbi:MAG: Uma2 family endonuclease [Phycisphaerales bacterium]|nr:Uma2 family endonuclease [Hyphomonadaceae bacterium]
MNAPVLTPLEPPRPLLASDVLFLVEHGLIDPNARFELMDGAIIPMSPKGRFHEAMRERIMNWLREPWTAPFGITVEHTLVLDAETIVEPDFILYDRARSIADAPLTGADIRLVIEVADSSWAYDTTEKAAKYAGFGVSEYWVVNAVDRSVRAHRSAEGLTWTDVRDIAPGASLTPLCAREQMITL